MNGRINDLLKRNHLHFLQMDWSPCEIWTYDWGICHFEQHGCCVSNHHILRAQKSELPLASHISINPIWHGCFCLDTKNRTLSTYLGRSGAFFCNLTNMGIRISWQCLHFLHPCQHSYLVRSIGSSQQLLDKAECVIYFMSCPCAKVDYLNEYGNLEFTSYLAAKNHPESAI